MTMRDGWISVEEKVPDHSDDVLVAVSGGYFVAYWDGDFWATSEEERMLVTVTHWQPIEGPSDD